MLYIYIGFCILKNEGFAHSLIFVERFEQIAQVAQQKWAYEWITCFFEPIAHSLIFSQKTSDSLRKLKSEFPALPYKWAKTVLSIVFSSRKNNP